MGEVIGKNFEQVKRKLDKVGCGFCLAKWTQVTMHLNDGTTHSCHHPSPHKVTLRELEKNPTALHNSLIKKKERKEMLEGGRPSACSYCWNIEDNSDSFSDRVYKSEEEWSWPHYDEIKNSKWRDDFTPKYVEVAFSNTCNFKCAYCGPSYSSKWVEEMKEHGEFSTGDGFNSLEELKRQDMIPIPHREENPYVEAFWKWWPDLYQELDTFRITGGEPLMAKDTFKVLDYILEQENPNTNLKLSINSNLCIEDKLFDKFLEKAKRIIDEGRVKEFIVYTSVDTHGKQAEFVRTGLDFEKLFKNIDTLLTELPKLTIVIMSTFNLFSPFGYEKLVKMVYDFKVKHFNTERYWNSPLILDTSYLRYPSFLSFRILKGYLDVHYFERVEKLMKFFSSYRSLNSYNLEEPTDSGFSLKEIEKITRLKDIFVKDSISDIDFAKDKQKFLNYIKDYKKRRNLDCEEYFPELKNFIS
jgi:organic radical activating enzyme